MFNISKNIITTLCFTLCCTADASTTDISMDFKSNNSCLLKFGETENFFNTINELSNKLNSITGDYLSVDSIILDNNNIVFNGVYNIKPCNITFSSSNSFKPGLILQFGNNSASFINFTIGNEISRLGFNYNIPYKVKVINMFNKSSSVTLTTENQPIALQYLRNNGELNFKGDLMFLDPE